MRGGAASYVYSARRALRHFPLLPAVATFLLVGLSVYASLQGTYQRLTGTQAGTPSRELRSMGFDEVAAATPPVPVPKVTCDIGNAHYKGAFLKQGTHNIRGSAEACRRSCKHMEGCNAWKWCDDHRNCRDERGEVLPFHGCQLKREALEPSGIPSDHPEVMRRMAPTQYTTGFLKHRNQKQSTFLRTQSAPGSKMLITTYVPPADCTNLEGNRVALMSILNKQDYARWHSYTFHLETGTADPTLRPAGSPDEGSWNKIGILRKLFEAFTPEEAQWILWMEPDAIFDDPSFQFPFEFYEHLDIITVADPEMAAKGHGKALSTGAMLMRNSKWTRDLLEELAEYAKHPPITEQAEEQSPGGFDPVAAAMMHIMRKRGLAESLSHFRFEGEFCMACDWRRIDLKLSSLTKRTTVWGEENKRWKLFITRFFDCETCWKGAMPQENLPACLQSYREHYEFAFCRFYRMSQAIQREAKDGTFLQQLKEQQIPDKGFNYTAFSAPTLIDKTLIATPQHLHTSTAQDCYEACLKDQKCGRWIWCSHSEGCDEMGTFKGSFPRGGCELSLVDMSTSPYEWNRGPQFSSFASGYISADHPARAGWASRLARQASSSSSRIVIASGLPTAPCTTPYGDLVIRLAVQNRQDYVRLHGHEYHLMAESVDPHLRMGAWQKLGFMKKVLNEVPRERAEWIIWMDMDIILDNMPFEWPVAKYEGKDFIIWGREDKITQGDVLNGVNSGVFLVRNTDWSRSFLDAWTPFGAFPANHTYDEMLRDKIVNFDIGMFEQNVIAYLVMQHPELLKNIVFEGDYCINCWYKDAFKSHIPQPPFVVHFAGCQVCTGFHPEKLGECDRLLVRTYMDSLAQLRSIVAEGAGKGSSERRTTARAVLGSSCEPVRAV